MSLLPERPARMVLMILMVSLLLTPVAAHAVNTTINPPWPGEATHEQILEQLYGVDFTLNGLHYTSPTVTATRLDDDLDQLFEPAIYSGEAIGVFALLEQIFGFLPGDSGSVFQALTAVTGNAFAVTGSFSGLVMDSTFRWARSGDNGTRSSRDSDNPAGRDHMVSYLVTFADNQTAFDTQETVWVLFFEDLAQGEDLADFDYNDLVVEIRATPIPEPGVLATGLLLGSLALLRRRRWSDRLG